MKRLFLITGIALMMVLSLTGLVLADGGPHGGYNATTDGCAGCHRAHTAPGPRLLVDNGTYDLCMSCHGSAGAGANTNVDDGFYLSTRDDPGGGDVGAANTPDNAPLLGGGFVNYQGAGVTSTHDPNGVEVAAWGNGVDRGVTANMAEGLSCASCHDPHGSPNYRILNTTVNGVAVAVAQVDEDPADKDYDTEQWATGTSDFCAACHGTYHVVAAGTGSDPVEAANGGYTHRVDMPWNGDGGTDPNIGMGVDNPETIGLAGYTLPLAETGTNNTVVCMTCHLPHGSSAQMTGIADGAGLPGETSAADSALLRLDNRGVCEVCHQK